MHQHVHACREEREVEIEVLRREHPLVVDGDGEGEKVPASIVLAKAESRSSETYHKAIKSPSINMLLTTFWSASFFSSLVISESFTIR